jgi:hypothetical protein
MQRREPEAIRQTLARGAEEARDIANKTLHRVSKKAVSFIDPGPRNPSTAPVQEFIPDWNSTTFCYNLT